MPAATRITKVVVHMYTMGTGDCFVLKFMSGNTIKCKMLIDCGCWTRKSDEIVPFIETLRDDVDGHIDVLVVTHEHTDHVLGFQAGKKIFLDEITVGEIWMGWTEEDGHPDVEEWREKYAERKMALNTAVQEVTRRIHSPDYAAQYGEARYKDEIMGLYTRFRDVLDEFAHLHVSGELKGGLAGMKVVKDDIAHNNIKYFRPGMVMKDLSFLPGVKVFVLGPPEVYKTVSQESGSGGESYDHNKDIDADDLFLRGLNFHQTGDASQQVFPFDSHYEIIPGTVSGPTIDLYENDMEKWRKIDFDWLLSSGSLALRMNSLTNNLSLALAFQFDEKKKVMLFPGDAEFGSWKSWHGINWIASGESIETKDLLARTVFYKVAHHLSHNGTARTLGLDLMTHADLAAMATLDYSVISSGWKSTMPNKMIIKDLLTKTKGRLMIMNPEGMYYDTDNSIPLRDKIDEIRATMSASQRTRFAADYKEEHEHFVSYTVRI